MLVDGVERTAVHKFAADQTVLGAQPWVIGVVAEAVGDTVTLGANCDGEFENPVAFMPHGQGGARRICVSPHASSVSKSA